MQATSNLIKQNITYLNDNIQNLNIKYEDFFNKNGKCNFGRIVLEIYETVTSDTTQNVFVSSSQKVSLQTLRGAQKLYTIRKVQEILKKFLNKDKVSIKRIHRPDNTLVCETLIFLRKLLSAGMILRKELFKINQILNDKKELHECLIEEKKNLEQILAEISGIKRTEENEKLLFQMREDIIRKEDIKEKLLLEVKRIEEDKECLKNEVDLARKKEIDLEKEHKQLLSLLRNAKSEFVFNDSYIIQENKRFQTTLSLLEDEKKDFENKIEKLNERFNHLHHLNEIIDTKNEALEYLKGTYESIKKVDGQIDDECKNIEETFKIFFGTPNEPLDSLRKLKLDTTTSIDVIKNVYIPKINESIENMQKMIEDLEKSDKNELFKKRYSKELIEFFK